MPQLNCSTANAGATIIARFSDTLGASRQSANNWADYSANIPAEPMTPCHNSPLAQRGALQDWTEPQLNHSTLRSERNFRPLNHATGLLSMLTAGFVYTLGTSRRLFTPWVFRHVREFMQSIKKDFLKQLQKQPKFKRLRHGIYNHTRNTSNAH